MTTDLSFFDLIVPCGIPQVQMTSVTRELDSSITMDHMSAAVTRAFGEVFDLEPRVAGREMFEPVPR